MGPEVQRGLEVDHDPVEPPPGPCRPTEGGPSAERRPEVAAAVWRGQHGHLVALPPEGLHVGPGVDRDAVVHRGVRGDDQDLHRRRTTDYSGSSRHSTGMKIWPGFSSPRTTANE